MHTASYMSVIAYLILRAIPAIHEINASENGWANSHGKALSLFKMSKFSLESTKYLK